MAKTKPAPGGIDWTTRPQSAVQHGLNGSQTRIRATLLVDGAGPGSFAQNINTKVRHEPGPLLRHAFEESLAVRNYRANVARLEMAKQDLAKSAEREHRAERLYREAVSACSDNAAQEHGLTEARAATSLLRSRIDALTAAVIAGHADCRGALRNAVLATWGDLRAQKKRERDAVLAEIARTIGPLLCELVTIDAVLGTLTGAGPSLDSLIGPAPAPTPAVRPANAGNQIGLGGTGAAQPTGHRDPAPAAGKVNYAVGNGQPLAKAVAS